MHDATLLVAPTEPDALRALGTTSPIPEHHGCDLLWTGPSGLVGVQRKELTDLWTSLRDGRLAREASLMRLLSTKVLLLEGRVRWTAGGRLSTARAPLTRDQLRGLLLSAQHRGLWVVHTDDLADTAATIAHLRQWIDKARHTTFERRPAGPDTGTRAWGIHLLQSFPSVGPGVAAAIHDHFGAVPLQWTVDAATLATVRGVGRVRARTLWSALDPAPAKPTEAAPTADEDVA